MEGNDGERGVMRRSISRVSVDQTTTDNMAKRLAIGLEAPGLVLLLVVVGLVDPVGDLAGGFGDEDGMEHAVEVCQDGNTGGGGIGWDDRKVSSSSKSIAVAFGGGRRVVGDVVKACPDGPELAAVGGYGGRIFGTDLLGGMVRKEEEALF